MKPDIFDSSREEHRLFAAFARVAGASMRDGMSASYESGQRKVALVSGDLVIAGDGYNDVFATDGGDDYSTITVIDDYCVGQPDVYSVTINHDMRSISVVPAPAGSVACDQHKFIFLARSFVAELSAARRRMS